MWDPADHFTVVMVVGWGWIILVMGGILAILLFVI